MGMGDQTVKKPTSDERKNALNIKKAQLQLLEMELSEVDAKLDAEFIEKIPTMLSDDEKEMRMSEDLRPYLSMIDKKREEFYREKLSELKGKVEGVRKEVLDEEDSINVDDAKDAFIKKHPEADMEAVINFFHNDTTKREKDEIIGQPSHLLALEKAYEIFMKKTKKEPPKKEPQKMDDDKSKKLFPPNMHHIPSSPATNPTADQKDDAYLKRIGLRK